MKNDHDAAKSPSPRLRKAGLGAALLALPVAAWGLLGCDRDDANVGGAAALPGAGGYDDPRLREVDPELVTWTQAAHLDVGLQNPVKLAWQPGTGNLLVVGDQALRILDRDGGLIRQVALPAVPTALAATSDRIYVALKDRLMILDAQGKPLTTWPSLGSDSHITSIALSGEDVWLADAGRRVVARCDSGGVVGLEIGRPDESRALVGLQVPSPHLDVAAASDGTIWIANPGMHRLEGWSREGVLQRYWGEAGASIQRFFGCCNPADFSILADGRFVTAEKSLPRVKVYSAQGEFESVVATPAMLGENRAGTDVTVDDQGRVLLLDPATRSIRVFGSRGGGAS